MPFDPSKALTPDDVGLCNCAGCSRELLGERTQARVASNPRLLPQEFREYLPVAQRHNGRPYCIHCWFRKRAELTKQRTRVNTRQRTNTTDLCPALT